MKVFFILIFTIVCTFGAFSQEELSASNWKMTQAKLLFEDNKPADALVIYLELAIDYPTDSFLNFRIAECYFKTGNYAKSLDYLIVAQNNSKDPEHTKEINFLQACSLHKLNSFDEAISVFAKISSGTLSNDSLQIKKLITQLQVAKAAFEHPQNYLIYSAGDSINSPANDFYPVFSRYEDLLYFTSDRQIKENQEKSSKTNSYPYSCFEAVVGDNGMPAQINPIDEGFATGKNYILNSVDMADAAFYLFKTSNEVKDGGDLYLDTKDTEEDFTDPERIPGLLNTPDFEFSASYDFINGKMFLVSNIKDKSRKTSDVFMSPVYKSKFPEPEMISTLSTDSDESFVYVHPGGDFIVISSNSEKSMGGYDLFISFIKDGKWSDPINMGHPINSTSDETQFGLSTDGKFAYIASDREGGKGGFDIYILDAIPFFTEKFGKIPTLAVLSGQVTDDEGTGVETTIKLNDLNDSKMSLEIKTDIDGYYNFVVNADSKYNLQIKSRLYEEYVEVLDFLKSTDTYIEKDIELIAKPK